MPDQGAEVDLIMGHRREFGTHLCWTLEGEFDITLAANWS